MSTEKLTQEQYTEKITALSRDELWENMPMFCAKIRPFPISWNAEDMQIKTYFDSEEWMGNHVGWLHGGIITTMLDNAMGVLTIIHSCGNFTPTVSLQVSFLRAVPTNAKVFVDARITKLGKTFIWITGELYLEGQENKPSATASGVYSVHSKAKIS